MKCHVIAGQQLNPPFLAFGLWWTSYKSKHSSKLLNLERLNLNATKLNFAKLCKSLLNSPKCSPFLNLCSSAQVVDASLLKPAISCKQVERNKLAARTSPDSRYERCSQEELPTNWRTPNVTCVVIVVVDCDTGGFAHTNGDDLKWK